MLLWEFLLERHELMSYPSQQFKVIVPPTFNLLKQQAYLAWVTPRELYHWKVRFQCDGHIYSCVDSLPVAVNFPPPIKTPTYLQSPFATGGELPPLGWATPEEVVAVTSGEVLTIFPLPPLLGNVHRPILLKAPCRSFWLLWLGWEWDVVLEQRVPQHMQNAVNSGLCPIKQRLCWLASLFSFPRVLLRYFIKKLFWLSPPPPLFPPFSLNLICQIHSSTTSMCSPGCFLPTGYNQGFYFSR